MDFSVEFLQKVPRNVLKNRNAVLKLQKRSPQLREIHRERFKCRLKYNRGEFMNRLRHMTQDKVQQTLAEEEKMIWNEMENDGINCVSEPFPASAEESDELDSELERWFMRMYEEYMDEDEKLINSFLDDNYPKELLCMVCESGKLVYSSDGTAIICNSHSCDTQLPASLKIEELFDLLQDIMEWHNASCDWTIYKSVQNTQWLELLCTKCNFRKIIK